MIIFGKWQGEHTGLQDFPGMRKFQMWRNWNENGRVPGDPFRSANSTSMALTHYCFLISSMCRFICINESRISHTRVPPYLLPIRNRESGMSNTDNSVCVCVCVCVQGRIQDFPYEGVPTPLDPPLVCVCVCVSKICLCRSATCVSFED